MMTLTKSARAWLERRMFGTVRNDLNLATTAITKPLQQADTKVNMVVNVWTFHFWMFKRVLIKTPKNP